MESTGRLEFQYPVINLGRSRVPVVRSQHRGAAAVLREAPRPTDRGAAEVRALGDGIAPVNGKRCAGTDADRAACAQRTGGAAAAQLQRAAVVIDNRRAGVRIGAGKRQHSRAGFQDAAAIMDPGRHRQVAGIRAIGDIKRQGAGRAAGVRIDVPAAHRILRAAAGRNGIVAAPDVVVAGHDLERTATARAEIEAITAEQVSAGLVVEA